MAKTAIAAPPINDFENWITALTRPTALTELAVMAVCVGLGWCLVWLVRKAAGTPDEKSILFGQRLVDGVLFPLVLLSLAYAARGLLAQRVPLAVFHIVIPAMVALVAIRIGVKVLQVAFDQSRLVRALERTISWVAWIAMVLWVSGLLPVLLEEADQVSWKVGAARLSVRNIIEGGLTAGLVLILTLWISSAIEGRLLKSATGAELSVRKAISNALRALLMFVGLIVALTAVGIDLTALSVLGGAIGVGIGLGLQKLASNYVSGFVILTERSLRIGDNVKVDNFEGRITDINARYTVIRSVVGRESIMPNEMLVTNRVENLSLADPSVAQATVVSVGYDSDVDLVIRVLADAAMNQDRVLKEPAPSVALSAFGADGLEFTISYWLADPENGSLNLRSLINLDILKSLRAHQISIPYPQRVIHAATPPAISLETAATGSTAGTSKG